MGQSNQLALENNHEHNLEYNYDKKGVFTIMTNAVEFFCIDMDKAIGRSTDNHIDYVEDLYETYLDISDLETMLVGIGLDLS